MAAAADTVLKILNGAQNGVEIVLEDGEYSIGRGVEDDLQFVDLALKEGHARLRLSGGKLALKAGSGPVSTSTGLYVEPGAEDWHEIDQLDVITVGATRFAVASATANWGQLVAAAEPALDERPAPRSRKGEDGLGLNVRTLRRVALPAAALVGILWFGATTLASRDISLGQLVQGREVEDIVAVESALAGFDFLDSVTVAEEVDGSIEIRGYVDSLVERRAIRNAVAETGVPVTLRIWVLDAIRSEVDGLIDVRDMPVDYTLSDDGVLTLSGIVLDPARANGFIRLLEEQLIGVRAIVSEVRTAETILAEVVDLADRSSLPGVLFRLDGMLIEATGAVASANIENWIGFLQAYSNRFADIIPLRAIVSVEGTPEGQTPVPVLVGRATGAQSRGGRELPRNLLNDTTVDFETVVAAVTGAPVPDREEATADAEATPAAEEASVPAPSGEAPQPAADAAPGPDAAPEDVAETPAPDVTGPVPASQAASAAPASTPDPVPSGPVAAGSTASAAAESRSGAEGDGTGGEAAAVTGPSRGSGSLAAAGGIERLFLGEAEPDSRTPVRDPSRALLLSAALLDLVDAVGGSFERLVAALPPGPPEETILAVVADPEARDAVLARAETVAPVDRPRFERAATTIADLAVPPAPAAPDGTPAADPPTLATDPDWAFAVETAASGQALFTGAQPPGAETAPAATRPTDIAAEAAVLPASASPSGPVSTSSAAPTAASSAGAAAASSAAPAAAASDGPAAASSDGPADASSAGSAAASSASPSAASSTAPAAASTVARADASPAGPVESAVTRPVSARRLGLTVADVRQWLLGALSAAGLTFTDGLRALDGTDTLAAVERILTDDEARDAFLDRAGVTDPARRRAFVRTVNDARRSLGIVPAEPPAAATAARASAEEGAGEAFAPVVISPEARTAFVRLTDATAALIEAFRAEELAAVVGEENATVLASAIGTIAPSLREAAAERSAASAERFLLPSRPRTAVGTACWEGGRISEEMLPVVLFWLDLLSVSEALRLSDLTVENRGLLIEAALSPERLSACLERIGTPRALALLEDSLYLLEARLNPGFVAFIVRGASTDALDIVGANLAGDRYVQLASGINLEEGAAPTRATRIASIGELGVLVRTSDGYSAAVYPPSLPWVLR